LKKACKDSNSNSIGLSETRPTRISQIRDTYCQRSEIDSSTLQRIRKSKRQNRAKSPMVRNVRLNTFTLSPKHKRKYFNQESMDLETKGIV
jgi:hypothetical protein